MKTIEEKAKAYDNALGWMREVYPTLTGAIKEDAEHYFPELAESEDERIIQFLINWINDNGVGTLHYIDISWKEQILSWLEKQKEHVPKNEESGTRKEQKPAWSEEEMKVLNSIIDDYEKAAKSFCGYDGKIGLLKAIRDGEYDLSKQEWSEEDESILEALIYDIERLPMQGVLTHRSCDSYIKFLKALRPGWKPSEEQLKELNFARLGRTPNVVHEHLDSLYNDLLKLK